MTIKGVSTPGLELVSLRTNGGWTIKHHRLFDVSPDQAHTVEVLGRGVTIWDLCFLEDLLLAENPVKGLLLDVGWYPHADPTGAFRLLVLPRMADGSREGSSYDWDKPLTDIKTRSLEELLGRIRELLEPGGQA